MLVCSREGHLTFCVLAVLCWPENREKSMCFPPGLQLRVRLIWLQTRSFQCFLWSQIDTLHYSALQQCCKELAMEIRSWVTALCNRNSAKDMTPLYCFYYKNHHTAESNFSVFVSSVWTCPVSLVYSSLWLTDLTISFIAIIGHLIMWCVVLSVSVRVVSGCQQTVALLLDSSQSGVTRGAHSWCRRLRVSHAHTLTLYN